MNSLISVIIPAYNEERDIYHCLESLKKQTYKPLEIIVIDDGSTDKTLKILKKIRGIRLIKQEHKGPGRARNKGAKKAKGDILVFVDADMTFNNKFVDKLTSPIRKGESIGSFSKEEVVANNDNRWARNWSINRGWEEGKMHPANYPDTQKVFRAIRKDKFEVAGGYDASKGYADDWTLYERLKIQATHADGALFYHRNPETLKEVFIQARWMAKRNYKLGLIGRIFALLRASFPVSFLIGIAKAIRYKSAFFIPFKLVVDFATFMGISDMFLGRKSVK